MVRRSAMWAGILFAAVLPLASCAGSGLEQSFAPDPQLQQSPTGLEATATLPPDFPAEIPPYPGAALQSVMSAARDGNAETPPVQTRWVTRDTTEQVTQFYRQAFQENGWSLESDSATQLVARRQALEVQLSVSEAATPPESPAAPASVPEGSPTPETPASPETTDSPPAPNTVVPTAFTLTYGQLGHANPSNDATNPEPSDPPLSDNWATRPSPDATASPSSSPSPAGSPQSFSDINQAPAELRPYISDLANLGVLKGADNAGEFKPNQTITRREYARWLVAANNALYTDIPAKQIRLAVEGDRPAFQDVPPADPDFAAIQGLANTGLIPSPLAGNSTTVRFRPDDPLTREELILWKVPLDTRQALPQATLDAIQQTWGFQDAAQIEPRAQRAVLADFQNSDLSNIRRAFGFTTLFQPKKAVTRAEAAAVLWHFGIEGEGISAGDAAG